MPPNSSTVCFECSVSFSFRKETLFCDLTEDLGSKLPFNYDLKESIRGSLNIFPIYSQTVLVFAMALQRWFLICRPTSTLLSEPGWKKLSFYLGFCLLSLLIPTVFWVELIRYPVTNLPGEMVGQLIISVAAWVLTGSSPHARVLA